MVPPDPVAAELPMGLLPGKEHLLLCKYFLLEIPSKTWLPRSGRVQVPGKISSEWEEDRSRVTVWRHNPNIRQEQHCSTKDVI